MRNMIISNATNTLNRLFGSFKSGLVTGLIIGTAIVVPAATSAQAAVQLEGSMGVANVTSGSTTYASATNATYDQTVKIQVYYNNKEDAASNKLANNVRVKLAMPAKGGQAQVVSSSFKADNSNEVRSQITVSLDHDDASLQYIAGSAVWKHNTGSRDAPKIEETKISDAVVYNDQGLALETQKPGSEYGATVSVLARVMVPGVKVMSESELKTDSNKWSASNSAKPGDSMRYIISYQNTATTDQKQVVARTILSPNLQLVPGTTTIYNSSNSDGVKASSDDITKGGIVIGDYGPGSNAYITFEAAIASADKLTCGNNQVLNVASVHPKDMAEYFSSAATTVTRECAAAAPQAVSSCDALTVTKGDNRKITAKVDYTASNGAKLKNIVYDFGDGSQPLTTDKTTVDYTYKKDGNFTVTAKVVTMTNDKEQTVTSAGCSKPVSFAAPVAPTAPTPPTPTPAPTPTAPVSSTGPLPNSGPGSTIALFVVASTVGYFGYRLFLSRKLSR